MYIIYNINYISISFCIHFLTTNDTVSQCHSVTVFLLKVVSY